MSRFLLSEERLRLISASKTLIPSKSINSPIQRSESRNFFLNRSVLQFFLILDHISEVFAHFPEESLI